MIDFQDFQNHGFWPVAFRACRKYMALKSYQDDFNDVQDALAMTSIDIKCIRMILNDFGKLTKYIEFRHDRHHVFSV